MGIVQRVKEGIKRLVKRPAPPKETVAEYQTQYDAEGRVVGVTKISNAPPVVRKSFTQRLQERQEQIAEHTKSITSGTKKVIESTGEAIESAAGKVGKGAGKVAEVITKQTGMPLRGKGVQPAQAMKAVRHDVLVGLAPIGGEPYYRALKKKRDDYGRRLSKKERQLLQKRFGKNWRQKLKQTSQGRYYSQATHADLAQARRERLLMAGGVNFGGAFTQFDTGIGTALTSDRARVPFARRADDPFDVDAMFGGGTAAIQKSRDKYNIDANFKGKLKL